ncbi:hypothetical protein [Streptomyces luteocolor]|uniref:hypothetical protein n=1 Tax=Streptomyces luteocolor TaxID=285500 RepID=UPI0008534D83|nr:hypothetical protein [Streptomyces luteocolor]
MTETRISQALIMLGGEPQDIVLDVHDGHVTLALGTVAAISLDGAPPEVLFRAASLLADAAAMKTQQLRTVVA